MRYVALILALTGCNKPVDEPVDTDAPVECPEAPATIGVDPCDVDFGSATVGASVDKTVTVSNSGSADLMISSMDASEPFSTPASAVAIGGCSQYQFSVKFAPTTWGKFTGDLVLHTNDAASPTFTCTLRGFVPGDVDGDGHGSPADGGDDCDDLDESTYPGADEIWYDDIDENCDGMDDYDQDGDGFETAAYVPDVDDGGGDCDDTDPAIYPGAGEGFDCD